MTLAQRMSREGQWAAGLDDSSLLRSLGMGFSFYSPKVYEDQGNYYQDGVIHHNGLMRPLSLRFKQERLFNSFGEVTLTLPGEVEYFTSKATPGHVYIQGIVGPKRLVRVIAFDPLALVLLEPTTGAQGGGGWDQSQNFRGWSVEGCSAILADVTL